MNFKSLKDISNKYYIYFDKKEYTNIILEMYNNINFDPTKYNLEDNVILNLIGQYYEYSERNYELMKKYYLIGIEKGCTNCMHKLALYYEYSERNYELMKKYYLMGIEQNNLLCIYNLALYYEYSEKDYELMKKYYLMGIEKNNLLCIYSLAYYYQNVEKNYDLMKKYYLMGIEQDHLLCIFGLGLYYQYENRDYNLMKKYYLMGIEKGCTNCMYYLKSYYSLHEKYNKLELYNLLYNLQTKSNIVIKIMNELSKNEQKIKEYEIKINMNLDNIKDCIVCYEKQLHIQFNCKHEICINCYCYVEKCFYRCY